MAQTRNSSTGRTNSNLCYGPRVDALFSRVAAVVIVTTAMVGLTAVIPASGGAGSGRVAELRQTSAELEDKSRSAVLELYALESRLNAARTRLASLRARADEVEQKRAAVEKHLGAARGTLRVAERHLAGRLRALYERGETDPLAVVLSAQSLEDALTTLDGLAFSAAQDRSIVKQTKAARSRLTRLASTLRARGAELAQLAAAAEAETASLERARGERADYVASLASQRRLNDARIAEVEAAAAAARERTLTVVAGPPAVVTSGMTLTVSASGYALRGGTATGVPAGWGVAAVDPSVIPLGTRFTVPGYGTAVAADTGGAIVGATIDLWFPSETAALAWGRRTVTIALL
jgi:3D (Asp-Asp-Asp) domain-containing protein/peptidoglycan hydrolase CwlO-like protein